VALCGYRRQQIHARSQPHALDITADRGRIGRRRNAVPIDRETVGRYRISSSTGANASQHGWSAWVSLERAGGRIDEGRDAERRRGQKPATWGKTQVEGEPRLGALLQLHEFGQPDDGTASPCKQARE
jgi:hypothetical protein